LSIKQLDSLPCRFEIGRQAGAATSEVVYWKQPFAYAVA
jgi:hypothetical protein